MLFNSLAFFVFLPIVFSLYWLIPQKQKWVILLVASYYFYMNWNPKYVVLILGTTAVSFVAGLLLEKTDTQRLKKIIIAVTLIVCLGVLFIFKYFNFASSTICSVLSLFSIHFSPITLQLMLPVGISFYTFQTLSYVIDVYRGDVKAEHHFGYYATFISFFPQLVAGPIERTGNLLPQIKSEKKFNQSQAIDGIKLIVWGYFKKMVIADYICGYVDQIYDNLCKYTGFALIMVIFLFTIQIYCDFSGYSNIAQGTAKLLGINLIDNFMSPYFSTSIKEFWRRWHISLSSWFKDYVYIPLGGNQCGKVRHNLNLLITFLVSGLWHGANWTFVFWGGLHGFAQIIENLTNPYINRFRATKVGKFISFIFVFVFCNIAWVFFRAKTFSDATYVLTNSLKGISSPYKYIVNGVHESGIGVLRSIYILAMITVMSIVDYLNLNGNIILKIKSKKPLVRWLLYFAIALLVVIYAQKGEPAEFVYFQF